jgi:hypothetical protein
LKRNLLLFVLIFSSIIAKAQGDYNYMPYGYGFDASTVRGYTNVKKQNNTLAFALNFNYYDSPYTPLTFEIQKGRLWGGSRVTDPYSREYVNNYTTIMVHGDLQMGEVIDYYAGELSNIIKNFYVGTGIGVVNNNVSNQRTDLLNQGYPIGTYVFPGKNHSDNFAVTFRIGYEFKFYNEYDEPAFRLDVGYVENVAFGEGLDGYNDPPGKFKNDFPNQYRMVTIGLKHDFGLIRAYSKRIRGVFN